MEQSNQRVRMWEEIVEIPTYAVGAPNPNPMFLEKRVYQGSSGKVYPYPVIDKVMDDKKLKPYTLIFLENEYLHVQIIPALGGRIYRALDKTNQYDFVYYNQVIKPALVGLAGPWTSGGIEFNWPQHHRPNTFGSVEYHCAVNEDGSCTVWLSEIDRMYGTKGMHGITLYPGKAYIEIHGQVYNRTDVPQTFLWWANPALAAHDETQSVFPPDVHAVFDHGKRDVSRFPIATGTYYKMDYSHGVDISRYRNIPVPTSYMAYHSDYDFIGSYDHRAQAGTLHVANHHISPGKKQWTWGCGDFGKAWDRNLTDENGPYIELMTGVYTDNQPDFTWIMPHEEKTFKQYFMPYKQIGALKNATIDAAVNLDIMNADPLTVRIGVYVTSEQPDARISLTRPAGELCTIETSLTPHQAFVQEVRLKHSLYAHELEVSVLDQQGSLLVQYRPDEPKLVEIPESAKAIGRPEELASTEALWLAGMHLEQYRHATFEPEHYYEEGLRRDPNDIRLNNALGLLLLRRGEYEDSKACFERAIETSTKHNPNPYDSECYYHLGLCLKHLDQPDEAYRAFYKSIWNSNWHDRGYYQLACMDMRQGDWHTALEHVDRSLVRNYRSTRIRNVKAMLLRKLGYTERALVLVCETQAIDPMDAVSLYEEYLLQKGSGQEEAAEEQLQSFVRRLNQEPHLYLAAVEEYDAAGGWEEGQQILQLGLNLDRAYPMLAYVCADFAERLGDSQKALRLSKHASMLSRSYVFPNSLLEYRALMKAVDRDPADAAAAYYLGNWLYDRKRHKDAIHYWEQSAALDGAHPTVHRNLAIAYYNKLQDANQAKASLEQAFSLNEQDIRVLYELDQLYKKIGYTPKERLACLEARGADVVERDDLYVEYMTLLNLTGAYKEALRRMAEHRFHPWEGGEGKITSQYVWSHVELARMALQTDDASRAIELLNAALVYPDNLGEGKLAGAQENHIYYYMGLAFEQLNEKRKATDCYKEASNGLAEPVSAMYYNDQPPEMIYYQGMACLKLGDEQGAKRRFHKLIDYGEQHIFTPLAIDYFAVSLPDFLVFEEDLNKKNEVHCRFMMGLGYLGMKDYSRALEQWQQVLKLEPCHVGVNLHMKLIP
ncbi:DUF5107 domain-containing protein [Paenibacillus aquistagni]|uniref:DUF5107 domain-containing protein n=1 Tax=Paenibacillus aquistagni TaxID=1852522 RepID=UPI000B504484|nr:DUF5107 domain-containing protein [Paenibacillus aquistagni]